MGQWEWIIILLIGMGLLVAELLSVRRAIRKSKAEDAAKAPPQR